MSELRGSLVLAVVSGLLLFAAFLFGSNPLWWGYDNDSREEMAGLRTEILDVVTRLQLANVTLVLIFLAGAALVVSVLRTPTRQRQSWIAAGTAGTSQSRTVLSVDAETRRLPS